MIQNFGEALSVILGAGMTNSPNAFCSFVLELPVTRSEDLLVL